MFHPPHSCAYFAGQRGLVNSWNEWDHLEEIIVGTASLAVIPPREPAFEMKVKDSGKLGLLADGGNPHPPSLPCAHAPLISQLFTHAVIWVGLVLH